VTAAGVVLPECFQWRAMKSGRVEQVDFEDPISEMGYF
jgi:hypothetical protein